MDEAEDLEQDLLSQLEGTIALQAIRRVDGLAARGARPLLFGNQRWNWSMTIPNYFMIAPRWISSWLSQNY